MGESLVCRPPLVGEWSLIGTEGARSWPHWYFFGPTEIRRKPMSTLWFPRAAALGIHVGGALAVLLRPPQVGECSTVRKGVEVGEKRGR